MAIAAQQVASPDGRTWTVTVERTRRKLKDTRDEPFFWAHVVVTAIIVASSVLGMASPFLLRAVIDTALPNRDLRLLALLAGGMVAVAALTAAPAEEVDI